MDGGVAVFSGGVGGAKLALGLYRELPPHALTVVANTGDDLELFGLRICPDSDILAYTLAGEVDGQQGWGIRGDSFRVLERVKALGGTGWFNLGDTDLGVHLFRTELLAAGVGLAEISRRIAAALGLQCTLLPMCEQPVATWLETDEGDLPLQQYLVRRRAEPVVKAIRFEGVDRATPAPGVAEALLAARMIVFAPSNPLISIGPILAVPGMEALVNQSRALKVGVSPIVGGKSLKGPSDRMLAQLGHAVSPVAVARMHRHLLDVFVIDRQDAHFRGEIEGLGLRCVEAPTVMETLASRRALAATVLQLGGGG